MKTVKQNAAFLLAVVLTFVMCMEPAYALEPITYTSLVLKYSGEGASLIHTDGTWNYDVKTDTWTYSDSRQLKNTWAYIVNPWNDNKPAWFAFDKNGKMLTGWQLIYWDGSYKYFYFHEASDGCRGECQLGGITPDGYTVNEDGAWTVGGVVQEHYLDKTPALSGSSGSSSTKNLIKILDPVPDPDEDISPTDDPLLVTDDPLLLDPVSDHDEDNSTTDEPLLVSDGILLDTDDVAPFVFQN